MAHPIATVAPARGGYLEDDPETTMSLDHLALSPSGFVFDPHTGATFTANPTALRLLTGLRDGRSLDALVAEVEGNFDTRGADVRRHVLEFVRTLQDEGVLPRDFELA